MILIKNYPALLIIREVAKNIVLVFISRSDTGFFKTLRMYRGRLQLLLEIGIFSLS